MQSIKNWFKNVIGEAVSSKKTLATAGVVGTLGLTNPKYVLIAFGIWCVCQAAVDVAKVMKGSK